MSASLREAEHALGDDVAEDLRRARFDRVAAAAELLVVPPAVVEDALGAEQLASELREALVLLRPAQLDRRPLGAGDAGPLVRAERAVVRVAERLELDPLLCNAVACDGVAVHALAREVDELVDADLARRG